MATVNVAKDANEGGIFGITGFSQKPRATGNVAAVQWTGQLSTAKWMTFYTKVPSKFPKERGLTLKASFELRPDGGPTKQQVDELRAALRELGLDDGILSS